MHLRVETARPYTLFPTKPTFVNHPPSYPYPPPPSTLGYHHQQPFHNILPYPHQYHPQQYHHHQHQHQHHQTFSYDSSSSYNNTVRRSSSAFEPLFYQQQQQQVLPPSPPTTPIPNMDRSPTLADFAASIVYLMWHARKPFLLATMKTTSPYRHSFSSVSGNASPAFKRFCLQVLTTTQLSESAVFLALKYIANLLESNPSIEGAEGSEYRLFIVALMLANKFLDDNTFTNKTWSEVSGMKVQDLNIMESEFLEALEYHLFVREEEYTTWKSVLDTCYQRYIHQQEQQQQQQQQNSLRMMTNSLADSLPLQRQEWITSTLHSLGLDKSSSIGHKHLEDQQQQDYIETDDDDDDDDDEDDNNDNNDAADDDDGNVHDVVARNNDDNDDDDDEMFQMMNQHHHLQQQQQPSWSTMAAATRGQVESSSQKRYQIYPMERQYHHHPPSSLTTPPLSSHRTERSSAFSRHTPDTTTNGTGRSSSFMQYGSSSSNHHQHHHHHALQPHRSSSVYRSSTTSVPPGFQRRASPWDPLRDRCGDLFYSHQPFHPYQRQVTMAPPPAPFLRTATTAWGE